MRAEVGLLTHNVVVRGSVNHQWSETIEACPAGFDTGTYFTELFEFYLESVNYLICSLLMRHFTLMELVNDRTVVSAVRKESFNFTTSMVYVFHEYENLDFSQ